MTIPACDAARGWLSCGLKIVVLTPENITELFRFALLLTGDADEAGDLLVSAVGEMPDELMQLRAEKNRTVWLLRKIRDGAGSRMAGRTTGDPAAQRDAEDMRAFHSLKENLGGSDPLPARLAALPEPERSTLALFYLDLLQPPEQAQFFGIHIEELSERLRCARQLLRKADAA